MTRSVIRLLLVLQMLLLVESAYSQQSSKEIPVKLKEAVHRAESIGQALYQSYQATENGSPATSGTDLSKRAAELAYGSVHDLCDTDYRPVVLPGNEGYYVYLIGSAKEPKAIMFGRHYRIQVDKSASKVISVTPLSKSCLIIPPPDPASIGGGKPVGAYTTHLQSPAPTEIHVFLSLKHRQLVVVGTSEGVWAIDKGKINFLGESKR